MNEDRILSEEALTGDLVVIQRNPFSGSGRGRNEIRKLITALHNYQFDVRLFARRDRLDHFVNRQPPGRLRCVVAAGGDGTVVSLVNRYPTLPVAILPMGTENLVARHFVIRCDGRRLAEVIRRGVIIRYDTARIGSRCFLVMASAGVDAAVVQRLHEIRSGNIRRWNYVAPVLHSFLGYSFSEFQIRSLDDDTIVRGTHAIVSNFPEYGFRLKLTPDAQPSDGLLDVCVFQGTSAFRSACHALKSLVGAPSGSGVVRFRSAGVRMEPLQRGQPVDGTVSVEQSAGGPPVQADGDPAGRLPVEIRVNPAALRLVVLAKDT